MAKTPFAYYGGKVGMARKIMDLMPPHKVYLEPFLGSGAVFFAKGRVPVEILNDLDDSVVTFFRVLRERPHDLLEACRFTPYARTEWEMADLRHSIPDDELEHARRFWVRINQSFGKVAKTSSGWSITSTVNASPALSQKRRLDRFAAAADRLADAMIENRDAVDLVERFSTPETVVYADPPYVKSARVAQDGYGSYEMTDEQHRRLAEVLRSSEATVIVSGYASTLYDEIYDGWWVRDFQVTGRSPNAAKHKRRSRIERLWINRRPSSLFEEIVDDYRRTR